MNSDGQESGGWPVWDELGAALSEAGKIVADIDDLDEIEIAEGYRYVTRMLRQALEGAVEGSPASAPLLRLGRPETIKGPGFDNPDQIAGGAALEPGSDYIVRGTRGTVTYLSLGTYYGRDYGQTSRSGRGGALSGDQLEYGPDGTFEINVSATPKPGNWLFMDPDTHVLIVRQLMLDRFNEIPAQLTIERVGGAVTPPQLSRDGIERRLRGAAKSMVGSIQRFAEWSREFIEMKNEMKLMDPARMAAVHGDPMYTYFVGGFALEPDQALIVEVRPPECIYWSLTAYNYWLETFDHRFHNVAVNKANAVAGDDGTVRVILSGRDPGLPNWIDTAGHRRGALMLRYANAKEQPMPTCRVVSLDELESS